MLVSGVASRPVLTWAILLWGDLLGNNHPCAMWVPHLQISSVTESTNKVVAGERGKLHQQHPVGFDGQGPVCEVPAFFLNDVVTFALRTPVYAQFQLYAKQESLKGCGVRWSTSSRVRAVMCTLKVFLTARMSLYTCQKAWTVRISIPLLWNFKLWDGCGSPHNQRDLFLLLQLEIGFRIWLCDLAAAAWGGL